MSYILEDEGAGIAIEDPSDFVITQKGSRLGLC